MKVLLIDDEEDIRKIGELSLSRIGEFTTLVAASALEGIALAAVERPDLVIVDMMMPGMDGLAALAELRKTPGLDQVPVLFMTARVQRAEIDEYVAAGALGVIHKPFDPLTLPQTIHNLLAQAGGGDSTATG